MYSTNLFPIHYSCIRNIEECPFLIWRGEGAFYWGESGHSPYYRGQFHLRGLSNRSQKSVLFTHQEEVHPGLNMRMEDFRMTVESTYRRAILRQSSEGISITRGIRARDLGMPIRIMNSKTEFHQPGIIRPAFTPLLTQ